MDTANKLFAEIAADPIRRRAKIAELSKRQTISFWVTMLIILLTISAIWTESASARWGVLCIVLCLFTLFKCESDLRLLRVVERLQEGKDEKPLA
jgi:hypothetical protein